MQASGPIGVFDSGIGGLSVLNALISELPGANFVYFADNAFAPYGERGDAFVLSRTLAVARRLVEAEGIKALVIACNSATAAAVHALRAEFQALPVIGIEPALKPAVSLSSTRHIAVLATRVTLESRKFGLLRASLADQAQFHCVPCDGLAGAIERSNADEVEALSAKYLQAAGEFGNAAGQIDTLVLGCTHYPFITGTLRRLIGHEVRFVDTGLPVAQQTSRLLASPYRSSRDASPASALQLEPNGPADDGRVVSTGSLLLQCSGSTSALESAVECWLTRGSASGRAVTVDVPTSAY